MTDIFDAMHRALFDKLFSLDEEGRRAKEKYLREAGLPEELIAELIRRDLPYYDPTITEETVTHMNRFAQDIGVLSAPVSYDQVVATQFAHLWKEPV